MYPATVKDERTRMEYLSAMGVDMFVPRRVLPGARASVRARLPVAPVTEQHGGMGADTSTAPGATSSAQPRPAKGATSTGGILDDILGQKPAVKKSSAAPQVTAAPAPSPQGTEHSVASVVESVTQTTQVSAEPVAFTLNVWRINAKLMVVDSHRPRSGLPTAALLSNMLRARQLAPQLPGADTLNWPMVPTNTGLDAARELVSAFLQSRLAQQGVAYIWLMGPDAYNAIAPTPGTFANHVGASVEVPLLNTLGLVMPSLATMLESPGLKAQAWQAIAPFNFSNT